MGKVRKSAKYIQLSEDLINLIISGVYKPGDILPSIRNMAKSRNLSITTVMRAYHELETRSLITAIPQSGFYVSFRPNLQISNQSFKPKNVKVDDIDLDRIVAAKKNKKSLLFFGVGRAAPELVPSKQLTTILSRIIHTKYLLQQTQQPVEGYDDLRHQIVKLMYLHNSYATPKDVIISTSCFSSIYLSFSAICQPNDLIATESPCNYGVLRVFQSLGLRIIEIPSKNGGIDVDELRKTLEKHEVKAIYVNPNCNNPLGTSMTTKAKKSLAQLVNEKKIPLIEDDATGELYFGIKRPVSIKSFDTDGYIIYCSSFSKILPLEFQVGWIEAGNYSEKIIQLKRTSNSHVSPLIQMAVSEYVQSSAYQVHLRKIRRVYKKKVYQMINDIRLFFPPCPYISNPEGGYQIWLQLPESLNSITVYKELLKYHLSVMPGSVFSAHDERYAGYIRLTASLYDENSKPYLRQIGKIISDLLHKSS